MTNSQTVIYTAANVAQAHLLTGLLEEQGIRALVANEHLAAGAGELPLGWPIAPRVVVAEGDAQRACELVLQWEQSLATGAPVDEDVLPMDHREWTAWPACPQCGARRQTTCPVCHVAGGDFPLADYDAPAATPEPTTDSPAHQRDEVEAAGLPLLMCLTCEEAFKPRFYRCCQWCGHDFGAGIELRQVMIRQINRRELAVVMGLASLALALMLYLWFLFRG